MGLKRRGIKRDRAFASLGPVDGADQGEKAPRRGLVKRDMLGKALAHRGHQVHFISTETPFRLGEFHAGLAAHQVLTTNYPLFREPQYLLSLANKLVQTALEFDLDIVHAHYAVPHATAAFLARAVLMSTHDRKAPRVVTTLHGTDITLVGNDPSFSEIVAFSIEQSDRVTAVSDSLRQSTYAAPSCG